MLELMRKHAGSWIIKIVLAAIAVAFALSFGVYSYYGSPQEVALRVNGEPITMKQVREVATRMTDEARAQMGEQFDKLAPLLNFQQRAMDRLVDQTLLFQEAKRMGIVVSQEEVRNRIASMEVFQRNGQFDLATYNRLLSRNRLTPEDFEATQRDNLIMEKLSVLVAGAAQITPLEVDFELEQRLTEVKGVYKLFNPDDYLKAQEVTQAELESFYNQNKRNYLVPEKLVLTYLKFPAADYRDQVDMRPVDVRDFYDINRNRYAKPERVHARHILFTLPEKPTKAQEEAARKLAGKVLELAKKPGQDFAKLAKEHSQGPTAKDGGDLGWFGKGQMVKPFEELAFKLKPGDIGMVQTRFGWHVIKVEDHQEAQITPLEKVEAEIKNELIERKAKDMAAAAAERAFDQIAKGGNLKEFAKGKNRSVYTTEPVAKGKPIAGLTGLKGLPRAVEGLAAGQHHHAREADPETGQLARGQPLARHEEMRQRQHHQRDRRHRHPGKARGHVLLAPAEQHERHRRTAGADRHHRGPVARLGQKQPPAAQRPDQPHQRRGKADPPGGQPERGDAPERDLDDQEGRPPDEPQRAHHQPASRCDLRHPVLPANGRDRHLWRGKVKTWSEYCGMPLVLHGFPAAKARPGLAFRFGMCILPRRGEHEKQVIDPWHNVS